MDATCNSLPPILVPSTQSARPVMDGFIGTVITRAEESRSRGFHVGFAGVAIVPSAFCQQMGCPIAICPARNSKRNSMAGPLKSARRQPSQQQRRYAVSLSRRGNSNCSTSSANGSRKLRRPARRFGGECAAASRRSRPSCLGSLIAVRPLSWAAMSANGKPSRIGERHRSSRRRRHRQRSHTLLHLMFASELSRKDWVQAAKSNLESWQLDLCCWSEIVGAILRQSDARRSKPRPGAHEKWHKPFAQTGRTIRSR